MKPVLLLNAVLLVSFFAVWCVLDYFVVKSPQYPQNCHDGEWTLIFIPLLTGVANLVKEDARNWFWHRLKENLPKVKGDKQGSLGRIGRMATTTASALLAEFVPYLSQQGLDFGAVPR
jgi:hypothetical protein